MVVYVFIAIAVVLAALDAFVFLIIKRLVTTTGKGIRRNVIKQLGAYDALFAAKSIELAQMQHQTKASKKNVTVVSEEAAPGNGSIALVPPAKYRSEGFTKSYRHVRGGFRFDEKAVYESVRDLPADENDDRFVKAADSLLARLNFDALYALTSLDNDEQLEVCIEACSDEEKAIIDEYMRIHERFDAPEFVSELRSERERRDNIVHVHAASGRTQLPEDVQVSTDASLCEGITLIRHGVMYDYGISEREIG